MTSFTSSFKRYILGCESLLVALLAFATIEFSIYEYLGPAAILGEAQKTALMEYNYLKLDVAQKYELGYKAYLFSDGKADIVQVGDSSGAYGVMPRIIERQLSGMHYVDISCCSDMGWQGYAYVADYFLRHNPHAKYVVLQVTPYSLPGQSEAPFTEELYDVYGGFWRFAYDLPSLYYRHAITAWTYRDHRDTAQVEELAMEHLGIDIPYVRNAATDLLSFLSRTQGWLPYDIKPEIKEMPVGVCGKYILDYARDAEGRGISWMLNFIADDARSRGVTLIVSFSPVACRDSAALAPIEAEIRAFARAHPRVIFLSPFIQTWPEDDFSDRWHLNPVAAIIYSGFLGQRLHAALSGRSENR